MTCLTIPHYQTAQCHSEDYPAGRKAVLDLVNRHKDLGYFIGGWDLLKKTKHFASPNIISVTEPEVESNFIMPLRCLMPTSLQVAKEFFESLELPDVYKHENKAELSEAYIKMIAECYPTLDARSVRLGEFDQVCAHVWFVDIEFVEHHLYRMHFLNEADALVAVDMIKAAL